MVKVALKYHIVDIVQDHRVGLIKLPCLSLALIASYLHGNINDFYKIMEIWKDLSINKKHLILAGDFIQAMGVSDDNSLKIMDAVMDDCKKYENFTLFGNQEWDYHH